MEWPATPEAWGKTIASFIAIGVSLVYISGYLSFRTQMTVLGIPAVFGAFDEHYLFPGASYAVFLAESLVIMLTISAVLAGLAYVVWAAVTRIWLGRIAKDRRGQAWTSTRRRNAAIPMALLAGMISLVSVNHLGKWQGETDLLFRPQLRSDYEAIIAAPDDGSRFWLFAKYVALAQASLLLAVASRRLSEHARPWAAAATLAVGIQIVALPILFGAIHADQPRPRIKVKDGGGGWLVWEDKDTLMYLQDGNGPEIVRIPKSNATIVIIGYGRILCTRFYGNACEVRD